MMTQTIAVERVDHIGVRVHDLDRALAFYRVLGFDLVRRPENDDVGKEEAQTRLGPGFDSLSLSGESYANLTSPPSTVQMLDAEPDTVTPGFRTRETRSRDRKTAPISGDWQTNSPRRQPVATQGTARIPPAR